MNVSIKTCMAFVCALLASAAIAGGPPPKPAQQLLADQRAAVATLVDSSQQTVVMAVDGLCCATCGIGVKKKLQKLAFVAPKGVKLDPANSIAIVTLKEAGVVDSQAMVTAIRKAGYEPVRFYQFDGQSAKETTINKEG